MVRNICLHAGILAEEVQLSCGNSLKYSRTIGVVNSIGACGERRFVISMIYFINYMFVYQINDRVQEK